MVGAFFAMYLSMKLQIYKFTLFLALALLPALRAQPVALPTGSSTIWTAPSLDEIVEEEDEGMGGFVAIVPQYDLENGTGSLLALSSDGSGETIQEREGEVVHQIYEFRDNNVPMLLVVWKSLEKPEQLSPELWVNEGYPSLVWGGFRRVLWNQARIRLTERKGRWFVQVARSLLGENQVQPLLRTKELYRITEDGLQLYRSKRQKATTPDQLLNVVADLAEKRSWKDMIAEVKRLPSRPSIYLQRAALLLVKHQPKDGDTEPTENLLRILVERSRSPEIAAEADRHLQDIAEEDHFDASFPLD
jgi:hypothetical protein